MAVSAIAESGTIAVGDTATPNTLTFLSTQFLPAQVAFAAANGFNQTVFAAQALGLALAGTSGFQTDWAGLSSSAFVTSVASATGLNASAIQGFLTNWTAFYTANGTPGSSLTITQAAYGATLGDAIGVALLNPTSANLQSVFSTTTANNFSPNAGSGLVQNALIDVATGQYTTGVSLGTLPTHTPLQGQGGSGPQGIFLTQGIDTPTSGFAENASGTPLLNGFTATTAGQVLTALPFVTALGLANNTLNTGDDLVATGAAAGTAVLNYTTTSGFTAANPPYATGVTTDGVATADVTNNTPGLVAGFQGTVTGLTTVDTTNSVFTVQVGATGQGIDATGAVLGNANITNYSGPNGSTVLTAIIASAAGSTANTINVDITGALGARSGGSADKLTFANDGGAGTTASPNVSYGTWAITANSAEYLQLQQGGVGDANTLTLSGGAFFAVGAAAAGDWQKLTDINASGDTATGFAVIVTGNSTTFASNFEAVPGFNTLGLFGSAAGLLTGNTSLTNFTGSATGTNIVDVSSFTTTTELGNLTATGNTVDGNNQIILASGVIDAASKAQFAGITDFQHLGDVSASGTINQANLPTSVDEIIYVTASAGTVTIDQTASFFSVDTEQNGLGNALTVDSTTGGTFNVGVGNVIGGAAGHVGDITVTGDEIFGLYSNGGSIPGMIPTITNLVNDIYLTPPIAGNETVTITGGTSSTGYGPISDQAVTIGTDGTGAIFDFSPVTGALNPFNMSITDANAQTVTLVGDTTAGSFLQGYSTNASTLDAHTAGDPLIMLGGDANFEAGVTPATSLGNAITGAPVSGNILIGSLGNDTTTSTSTGGGDTIVTDGGGDIISLAGQGDTIDVFAGVASTAGVVSYTTALGGVAGAGNIVSDIAGAESAHGGWWGLGAGSPLPVALNTVATAAGFGTSGDSSVVSGAANGTGGTSDVVGFSTGAWSGFLTDTSGVALTGAHTTVFSNLIGVGGTITTAHANVIDIGVGTFDGAATLANSIAASGITLAAAIGTGDHSFLVAYQNSANGGGVTLADLFVDNTGGATTLIKGSATEHIAVSDMVELTGVSAANLAAANVHLIA